jgi:hypothetical protein
MFWRLTHFHLTAPHPIHPMQPTIKIVSLHFGEQTSNHLYRWQIFILFWFAMTPYFLIA